MNLTRRQFLHSALLKDLKPNLQQPQQTAEVVGGGKQAIFSVSTVVHKIRIDWLGEKKLNQVAIFNTRPTCMYRDMFVDINW